MRTLYGQIFSKEGVFRRGSICIGEDGRIARILYEEKDGKQEEQEMVVQTETSEALYILPGLVDVHLHGCRGYDFCDGTEEAFEAITSYEKSCGVTALVPATMTLPEAELEQILKGAAEFVEKENSMKGICMEGPFIAKEKKGAQSEVYIQLPSVEKYHAWQELARGNIRQITVAPEIAGATEFIRKVSEETVVSIAHTDANYVQAKEAIEAGANHVTHLFNGMSGFGHREPGVAGAAFDEKDTYVELICDGEHVHPSMVRTAFRLYGAKRICMISDSMRATGMPDGEYTLGGQKVWVEGKQARLKTGNLAGSVCTLYECLQKVVLEMGVPLEEAVCACTLTPAASLGLEKVCGVLEEGMPADILLVDGELNLKQVIIGGRDLDK